MEDMRIESPKPKTGVVVTAVIASAVIFGGLGYYIGQMYETAPAGTVTYASPSESSAKPSYVPGTVVPSENPTSSPIPAEKLSTTYTSKSAGYSIQYPSGWKYAVTSGEAGSETVDIRPSSNGPAGSSIAYSYPGPVNITSSSTSLTLAQYGAEQKAKNEMPVEGSTSKETQTAVTIDGVAAIKQTFTVQELGTTNRVPSGGINYFVIKNGKLYVIKQEDRNATAAAMVASFKFTN